MSRLVEKAVKGEFFIIVKAGKPLVKVIAMDAPRQPQRLGFMMGEIGMPDDFDRMDGEEIEQLFGADVE